MSELKAMKFFEAVPTSKEGFYQPGAFVDGYLKSEADKVIADLKDKLQKESALLKETREWLIESQKMHKRCADNASRIIRHSNHKRCLAKANWCFDEGKGTPTVYEVRTFYWGRWGNIWLALAEEPTWAKFLQLIHKEAK